MILRCPMIRRVNDNYEHFFAIEKITEKYPHIEIEKLEYYDMGL